MTLIVPSFTIPAATPNPNKALITDAEWWYWLQLHKLEPKSKLGGIYANKSGFHNTAKANAANWPSNYSIRESFNRAAPGDTKARALDWTFPDAQGGNFDTIAKYTQRLFKSALDPNDPRLDLILFEFYGNSDHDREVEGYNEYRETRESSDPTHLWHLHKSFRGDKCGDFWGMWALLTVEMGASTAEWRASLPSAPKPPATPPVNNLPKPGLPVYKLGARTLEHKSPNMKGTDVLFVQTYAGGKKYFGDLDGIAGEKFDAGVKRYQGIRGLKRDGIVGDRTWAAMGIR